MKAFLVLALVPGSAASGGDDVVHHVDASIETEGELLGGRFLDVDLDGRRELCLAVASGGERELRFHRVESHRIDPEPYRTVVVKKDVIAYAFADMREEPGNELLMMGRSGFYSYSLEKAGYRGNFAPLVRGEMLFDVGDPKRLREWRFVLESRWGDRLLVPGREGVSVWGLPSPSAGAAVNGMPVERGVLVLGSFPAEKLGTGSGLSRPEEERRREKRRERERKRETRVTIGSSGVRIHQEADRDTLLLPYEDGGALELLSSGRSYGAPALADLDRDGNVDLLFAGDKELLIHLAREGGFATEPDRVEAFPPYLDRDRILPTLYLGDLDGDGDTDLVAQVRDEEGGLKNVENTLYCLVNDGTSLFPEKPHQLLRFKAGYLRVELADVDGDGRLDLALRKFELPGMVEAVSGLEFTLTHLVYLGQEKGTPFARKPMLRQSRVYDETTFSDILANRELDMDCDGDGIADLVEVDLKGRIAIRRLKRSSGFFGGGSWSIEETPWKRFEVFGNIESVRVSDVNGDGIGDVVSRGDRSLTVLLSRRRKP